MFTVVACISSSVITISCLIFTLILTVNQVLNGTDVATMFFSVLIILIQLFLTKVIVTNTRDAVKHLRISRNKISTTSK